MRAETIRNDPELTLRSPRGSRTVAPHPWMLRLILPRVRVLVTPPAASRVTTVRCSARSGARRVRGRTRSRSPARSERRPRAPASRSSGQGSGPRRRTSSATASPTPSCSRPRASAPSSSRSSSSISSSSLVPRPAGDRRRWSPDLIVHEVAELAAPLVAAARGCRASITASALCCRARSSGTAAEAAAHWVEHGLEPDETAGLYRAALPRTRALPASRSQRPRRSGARRCTSRCRPTRRFRTCSTAWAAGRSSTSASARSGQPGRGRVPGDPRRPRGRGRGRHRHGRGARMLGTQPAYVRVRRFVPS